MLFHITQTHPPEQCPKDEGGSTILYNPKVEDVKLLARYRALPEHIIYYVVAAETLNAVESFLMPGFERYASKITPVSPGPIVRGEGSGSVSAKHKESGKVLP
jgi:hypothetical protein